jgi:micrococcal nuclease
VGKVIQFGLQPRKPLMRRRRVWRIRKAPWSPIGALVGVAIAVNLLFELPVLYSGIGGGFGLCRCSLQHNCVVDGDTIRFEGVTIRLADIDAPETRDPKCAFEADLGDRATRELRDLMNAGSFDVVSTGGRDQDIYGRKLRVVMRDGQSFGNILIAKGLARPWDGARRSWCG